MEDEQISIHELEGKNLLESQYRFDILELNKNLSERTHKKKINLNETLTKNDDISMFTMIFYSIPAFSKMSCLVILSIHAIIYYENLGANLLYISFFVALARAIEIILKPVIAHFSDNLNKKIGRRKPFMLIGMPFYALFFVILFNPPVLSSFQISLFFGVFYVLFFIADTICNVPYYALGPELSTDSREREKLYIIYYIFQYLGVLFASSGPVLFNKLLKNCDCSHCDKDTVTDKVLCQNQCKVTCDFTSNQSCLLYMCMIIGLLYVFSIILLSFMIKEKKIKIEKKDKAYVVPKFFRIINNAPFMKLLVPWILDVTISTIFATMLPFFLSVIINPQKYCLKNKIDLTSEICYTNTWLGYSISTFFIFCMVSMVIWHYVVKSIGKKNAWSLYSLISILTFSLFLFCEEGSFALLIIVSILNAIPAGGAYLNDVFVADIIDYDEFITGKRNEGLYTVFSTFIPKIVSIFAQSIPLTILGIIGFVSSRNGENMQQPIIISEFIKLYFIGIPILFAIISFYYKIKYPIENENKMQVLRDLMVLQKQMNDEMQNTLDFYKIRDPIMLNYTYQLLCKTEQHYQTKAVAEHFNCLDDLNMLMRGDYRELTKKMLYIMVTCLVISIILILIVILTFGFLEIKSLSFIPILSLLILAVFLVLLILNYLRYKMIKRVHSEAIILDKEYLKLHILAFQNFSL